MKKEAILCFLFLVLAFSWVNAQEIVPVAVSPGSESGVAVVGQICPTFSWTAVDWASKYRVVVFEAVGTEVPAYEQIAAVASPVLNREVIGRALSWTPSAEERLRYGGLYIWYVQAADLSGQGRWSEGRAFKVVAEAAWDVEMEKRMIKSLEKNGVSEDITEKVLQDMRSEVIERAIGEFDLQGGFMTQGEIGVQGVEGTFNTFYGRYAGASNTTGNYNAFFGYGAGNRNTLGLYNTFIGGYAGYYNTTANSNTFIGYRAGLKNTTGAGNTSLGSHAGYENTTGSDNTFIGMNAGYKSSGAYHNTFMGAHAGYSNTIGYSNTFMGYKAGYSNTTGSYNTFIGIYAGYWNTTGSSNTFMGYLAGYANRGSYNTFIGNYAGSANQVGESNVFLGYEAGRYETGSNKLYLDNSSTSSPLIYGDFSNNSLVFNGNVGISIAPTHQLHILGGAYCDGGAWVDGSSREYKDNIEKLTTKEALAAFQELEPVKYNYKTDKNERYLGFIAEDVPELLAMKDRKGLSPMDVVAVLTKVVQEQQKTISELEEKIAKLERKFQTEE